MNERFKSPLTRLIQRLAALPFRILAYVLHATGLERFFKPRLGRHTALFELTDDVVSNLPKNCHTITGAISDPMNLIFVASEANLKRAFRRAAWRRANPASPVHILYGLITALLKRPYPTGPFAPLYVNIALQDLAYQQSKRRDNYRQRHHLRIWRTGVTLSDGKRVWVGAAGRENGMRLGLALPFYTHALDPNIDEERDYVVKSLSKIGAERVKSVALNDAILASHPKRNVFGSQYFTDGRAVVVSL